MDQHPKATFAVKSFENLPKEWKAGVTESFKMTGTLTVRGISKDVTFDAKAQLDGSQLKLEGQTVVTFEDYGMKNPHTVVLSAQNDVTVQLRLVLAK
ncbi:YceI-like domain protein [compost metagenome]